MRYRYCGDIPVVLELTTPSIEVTPGAEIEVAEALAHPHFELIPDKRPPSEKRE